MEANPNLSLERAGPWGGQSQVPPGWRVPATARGLAARVVGAAAGFGCPPSGCCPALAFPSHYCAKPLLPPVRTTTVQPWEE